MVSQEPALQRRYDTENNIIIVTPRLYHAPRRKRRPLARLDQVHDALARVLAVVLPLELPQEHMVDEQEHGAGKDERGTLDGDRDVCGDGPPHVVLDVDDDERGDEAGEGVERQGQVDAVEEPDVVVAPAEGEIGHAQGAEAEDGRRRAEQGHRGDLLVRLLRLGGGGRRGGRAREVGRREDEGEQDHPREQVGEDVMGPGDLAVAEEHVHVSRLEGPALSLLLRLLRSREKVRRPDVWRQWCARGARVGR